MGSGSGCNCVLWSIVEEAISEGVVLCYVDRVTFQSELKTEPSSLVLTEQLGSPCTAQNPGSEVRDAAEPRALAQTGQVLRFGMESRHAGPWMISQEGMKGAVLCQATKAIGKIIVGTRKGEEGFLFSRMCGLRSSSLWGWEGCGRKEPHPPSIVSRHKVIRGSDAW